MKKIRILNGFIIFMISFQVFSFGTNIYLSEFSQYGEMLKSVNDQIFLGHATQYVHMLIAMFTFIGLIYIQGALSKCINKGYFNVQSSNKFKKAALFLLLSGGFGLIFDLILFWEFKGGTSFGYLGMDFFMLIIAFSLYVIADVIENGSLMRQDNELTI